jgi:hypothetical protein
MNVYAGYRRPLAKYIWLCSTWQNVLLLLLPSTIIQAKAKYRTRSRTSQKNQNILNLSDHALKKLNDYKHHSVALAELIVPLVSCFSLTSRILVQLNGVYLIKQLAAC